MSASAPALFRLPPSASRREHREWKEQMLFWLSDKLDEQHIQDVRQANAAAPTPEQWVETIAIHEARSGDPTKLRKLYPHFANCISSPGPGKGKSYKKSPKYDAAKETAKTAADFVRRIRALWRQQYGKVHREHGEISAHDFAIQIIKDWSGKKITISAVLAAAKKSGKHKPGRRTAHRKKPRQMAHPAR
jgi:hypothetical protein